MIFLILPLHGKLFFMESSFVKILVDQGVLLAIPQEGKEQYADFIFFSLVSTVHHLCAEVPIKVLCGAGEQSSQMPAGLCM
jgi:hypothetical protein